MRLRILMLNLVVVLMVFVLISASDDKEAIDRNNIIDGDRLRHAKPAVGKYQEKEEDDLPEDAR
jgi:hypothetical protein